LVSFNIYVNTFSKRKDDVFDVKIHQQSINQSALDPAAAPFVDSEISANVSVAASADVSSSAFASVIVSAVASSDDDTDDAGASKVMEGGAVPLSVDALSSDIDTVGASTVIDGGADVISSDNDIGASTVIDGMSAPPLHSAEALSSLSAVAGSLSALVSAADSCLCQFMSASIRPAYTVITILCFTSQISSGRA